MSKKTLDIDVGDRFDEAKLFMRENQDNTLEEFIKIYKPKFPKDKVPSHDDLNLPLSGFIFQPIQIKSGECIETGENRCAGGLRLKLDQLWEVEQKREPKDIVSGDGIKTYPERISEEEAVKIAYFMELDAIADFLRNDLSVLVLCDKMLTELIYDFVVKRAGKQCVKDTDKPENLRQGKGSRLDQSMQGGHSDPLANLSQLFHNLKDNEILVLRSLDMLDNPPMVELLYQYTTKKKKPQILAFLDPSLEAKKVLTDRFSVHVTISGLPRYVPSGCGPGNVSENTEDEICDSTDNGLKKPLYCVMRLLTKKERACFAEYDPEGLYKNVAGLNAVQFRNAMQYLGARVAEGSESRDIYRVIRQFKTSSSGEIEIPDTSFKDIGGYESVKHQLQRIISLISGPIQGLKERQRGQLIPRGFIFHGPPGTGKTLFAKAIANEMNATIQMISGPEIMDKYVGESENKLRRIFATARRNAPAVVFFDEFDSIASQRSSYTDGGARANNAVVAQLLTELDGFRQDQTVLVIGTTNRIDIIDEALLRPSRLRPVEIGKPDTAARRHVAKIHAGDFGVDKLVKNLCELASDFIDKWEKTGKTNKDRVVPDDFLNVLFKKHKPYEKRYKIEEKQAGFKREIKEFFSFVHGSCEESEESPAVVEQMKEKLVNIGKQYGLDLENKNLPDSNRQEEDSWMTPMRSDIRDLFTAITREKNTTKSITPKNFWNTLLELIAEYTEQFNNDEIRAIFQEASLEHHMEGQLITPRYIGRKIGLIQQRRDEREAVHIGHVRE
ncbi:ATP-binding protein [Desulfobacterales bacterium HSG16]|nr:ATP-binding protein [Desulfobacterales bacterium HSG16]